MSKSESKKKYYTYILHIDTHDKNKIKRHEELQVKNIYNWNKIENNSKSLMLAVLIENHE